MAVLDNEIKCRRDNIMLWLTVLGIAVGIVVEVIRYRANRPPATPALPRTIVRTATVNYFVDRGFAPVSVNLWRSLLLVPL